MMTETPDPTYKPYISLVIPAFNEAVNITHIYPQLVDFLSAQPWRFELIYVNDGSDDNTGEVIRELAAANDKVRFIEFSRNFGKEAATTAGLRSANGDAVVMMDGDGQFPIEVVPKLVSAWQEGARVVVGVRKSNQREGWFKRFGSRAFNWVLNPLTGGNSVPGETDFRLIDRQVVEEFKRLTERNRITRGLIDWLGFKRVYIPFHAKARLNGKPSYTPRKLIKLALHTFVSQSTRPLLFSGLLGVFVMGISLVAGISMVVEEYILHDPLHLAITGTAILAAFLSFLIGIVLACQGLLALYIESIHNETQNRPLYIISDKS
jgi:glycosyltransferase involved in cell wall biosynthesis